VVLCALLEWTDSAGGMGYGTILTPLLFFLGFDPKQVVPLVMITEMVTGVVAGLVHGQFENVEWKLRPMNETTKLMIVVAATGMVATMISVSAVYAIFMIHKFWIKVYVAILLAMMGVTSIFGATGHFKYRPRLMWIFAFVGGFNKGVGGGGYGPVITIGGLLSGVPVKSMVAITSLAEGLTCFAAVVMWFAMLSTGIVIDYMLLPSFVIGTVVAAVFAPWTTRVIPEIFWRWAIPVKCCLLAAYAFYKLMPEIMRRF
ncbi:MAG: sulfite exporter TauE/SafE family protein, partial [Pseudomonadota bacterium]